MMYKPEQIPAAGNLVRTPGKPVRKRRGMAKLMLEERAFIAQQEELRKAYPGQFVAIHEGRVVDSDQDEFVLHHRLTENYPMEAILVQSVDWIDDNGVMATPFEPDWMEKMERAETTDDPGKR